MCVRVCMHECMHVCVCVRARECMCACVFFSRFNWDVKVFFNPPVLQKDTEYENS